MHDAPPRTDRVYAKAKLIDEMLMLAGELGCSMAEQTILGHLIAMSWPHESDWAATASLHRLAGRIGCGISHCRISVARLLRRGLIEALTIGTGPSAPSVWLLKTNARAGARALGRTDARAGARASARQRAQLRAPGRTEARAPARADHAPSLVVFQDSRNSQDSRKQEGPTAAAELRLKGAMREAKAAITTHVPKADEDQLDAMAREVIESVDAFNAETYFDDEGTQLPALRIDEFVLWAWQRSREKPKPVASWRNLIRRTPDAERIDRWRREAAKKIAVTQVVVKRAEPQAEQDSDMSAAELMAIAVKYPPNSLQYRAFVRRAQLAAEREQVLR